MPSLIQGGGDGSPSVQLSRAFGLVGKFATFADEVLLGAAIVADLSEGGPRPLIYRAQAAFSQAAVAAEVCVWRLELPPGMLGKIRKCYVSCGAATFVNVGLGATFAVPANTAVKAFQEGRLRVAGRTPAGVLTFDTNATGITPLVSFRMAGGAAPGTLNEMDLVFGRVDAFDFVEFAVGATNQTTFVALEWDEQLAE
jgi:hypothetical protein